MKKYYYIIVALAAANIMLLACNSSRNDVSEASDGALYEEVEQSAEADSAQIEAYMDAAEKDPECRTGGRGSASCRIAPGVDIGGTRTIGCSVTCEDGYYACCGLRCTCKPESESAE